MRVCVAAVAVVGLMVACRRPVVDDCKLVLGDPAHAVAEIGKRYPDDPVKRATVIERCVAPDGEDCERLDRIARAIPGMMPGTAIGATAGGSAVTGPVAGGRDAAPAAIDYRAACLGMPAEMRRCMLPSYLLGHDAECRRIREQMVSAIDIVPATHHVECDGGAVAVYLTAEGLWLGTGPDARCFDPRHGGALGTDWLEAELRQLRMTGCRPAVEIASAAGVHYQDVIAAMDAAVKVGLVDVGLSRPEDLPVSFAGADARRAAHHCSATTVARGDTARSLGAPALPAAKDTLRNAPVVIVTRTEVSLGGRVIGTVAEIARGSGPIEKLDQALPHNPADPTLILQADQDTDMAVISRVTETAKAAGYPNMLFAVKNK